MKTKIFVLDDEQLNIFIIQKTFKHLDFIVCSNPMQAIEMIKNNNEIGIILLDIYLGANNITGVDVMKSIKKELPKLNIPTVAVTSYSDYGDESFFLEEGFSYYLPKPLDPVQFNKIIQKHLFKFQN